MNLKQIIKEELEAESFQNLVDMIKSDDLDQTSLALQIAKANKTHKQFEETFNISLKTFSDFFNNVILKINNKNLQINIFKGLVNLRKSFNIDRFNESVVIDIIQDNNKLYKYFNLKKLSGIYIVNLLDFYPDLVNELDLSRLVKDGLTYSKGARYILAKNPELYTYFDLTKINEFDKSNIINSQPELAKHFKK